MGALLLRKTERDGVASVRLMDDLPATHEMTTRFVESGVTEGWIMLGEDTITLRLESGDATYRITEFPFPGSETEPARPSYVLELA
jgi:hypothetical protein